MAQYRAIFQNAYFKGLATAAVVTMGLAAGQAQAGKVTDFSTAVSGGTIEITTDALEITTATPKDDIPFTVDIKSASTVDNKIEGAAASAKLATFTISGKDSKLTVAGTSSASGSLTIGNLNVNSGSVAVTGAAQGATLVASNIKVANGAKITASSTDAGVATLGDAKTKYVLESGSTIEIGSGGAVLGDVSNSSGGTIHFTDAGTLQAFGTGADLNITVDAKKTGTIELAATNDETTSGDDTSLSLAKGTIEIQGADQTASGILHIKQGNVSLGSDVVLAATTDETKVGTLKVGDSAAKAQLSISKATLTNFLSDKTTVTNHKKGALDIAASGNVVINDDIKLSDFEYAATAEAGKISATAGAQLTANTVTVEKEANNASALTVVANDKLTLGKSGTEAFSAGVAALQAKNVQFIGKDNDTAFVLQDKLTLQNVKNTGTAAVPKYQAQVGTVTGDFTVSGDGKALKVDGGIYTLSNNVKLLESGSLTVSNSLKADKSLLKFDTGSKLDLTAASKSSITVGSGAELDISDATLSLKTSSTDKEVLKVNVNSGTFTTSGQNLTELLTKDQGTSDTSGAQLVLNKGTIKVTDSVTLDKSIFKSAGAADAGFQIVAHEDNGGTLDVAEKLTLTGLGSTAFVLKDNANFKAKELELKVTTDTETANIGSGNYTVFETLASNSKHNDGVTLATNATLNLGAIEQVDKKNVAKGPEAGQITTQLTTNSGKIAVNAGSWTTTEGIKVGGKADGLVVGNDGTTLDANDNKISPSLTIQGKLDSAFAGGVKVEKTGTLKTAEIASIAGGIEVSGALVVDGKITKNASDDTKIDSYGVSLSGAKAIDVKEDASLSFGEAATQAIKLVDGQTAGVISSVANQDGITSYTEGALKSEIGSTVSLAFADTVKFDADGLDSLRKLLFGADHATNLGGFLNIGKASIAGLDNVGETIKWSELSKYDDVTSNVTNEKLQQAVVTEITSTDEIRGNVGALSSNLNDSEQIKGTSIIQSLNAVSYYKVGQDDFTPSNDA